MFMPHTYSLVNRNLHFLCMHKSRELFDSQIQRREHFLQPNFDCVHIFVRTLQLTFLVYLSYLSIIRVNNYHVQNDENRQIHFKWYLSGI